MKAFVPMLLLASALVGCDSTPSSPPKPAPVPTSTSYWVTTRGYVRYVTFALGDAHTSISHVVIETEQGQVFTVSLLDAVPPVWVGMHAEFAYESAGNNYWKNFIVKQRLPDAQGASK